MSKYSIFNAHNRTLLLTEIYSIEAWQVLGLLKYHFTLFEQYVLSQMLMLDQYSCLLITWYQCLVKFIFQFVLLLVYRPVLYDSCNNHNKVYRIQMDWQPTAKCILKGTFAIYFTIDNIILLTFIFLFIFFVSLSL